MQPDQEELSAVFVVKDVDGIKLTTSEPDVFRRFDGSAEEQRQISAAVIAFCEWASSSPAVPKGAPRAGVRG